MTEPTLTEEDIDVDYDEWGDHTLSVSLDNKKQGEQLKQKILENQRLRELVEKEIEICKQEVDGGFIPFRKRQALRILET